MGERHSCPLIYFTMTDENESRGLEGEQGRNSLVLSPLLDATVSKCVCSPLSLVLWYTGTTELPHDAQCIGKNTIIYIFVKKIGMGVQSLIYLKQINISFVYRFRLSISTSDTFLLALFFFWKPGLFSLKI